jgi:arginase family enzyme
MDLSAFFDPVDSQLSPALSAGEWGQRSMVYQSTFPDWQAADVLLLACGEARGGGRGHDDEAATAIREQLYRLSCPDGAFRVADLGTLKPRETPEGAYEALAYVLAQCLQANKTVLLFGGSQDLTLGQYMAYEDLGRQIQYVHLDGRLDLGDDQLKLDHQSYNRRILARAKGVLKHFASLGYQRYLVSADQLRWLQDQHHETLRYGELGGQIEEVEPALRLADMVSLDLSAIRASDAPGVAQPSPGGFSAMEACRLARYAGLAYDVSTFQLSELCPAHDLRHQTALLSAMLLWYFVDGYYSRWDDQPEADRSNLRQYSVQLHASVEKIDFYKHPGTERWWMAVPYPDRLDQPLAQTRLVPCSARDYDCARQDDIPLRWWLQYHKPLGG